MEAIRVQQSRMKDAQRGVNVTTSDAVRCLILAGLDASTVRAWC
jgi:hypothetical protein